MVLVAALAAERLVAVGTVVDVGVKVSLLVSREDRDSGAFLVAHAARQGLSLLFRKSP